MKFIDTKIPVSFYKEGNQFIAYCPALDISTCADTFEEAQKNFVELLDIFINETVKMGTLEEVLLECGWKKIIHPKLKWQPPVRRFITETTQDFKLPCPA